MLFSYRQVITRLNRIPFRAHRPYYLGFNKNTNLSEETVIELLKDALKQPNSSVRYKQVHSLFYRINFHKLPPSILAKAIHSQKEILKMNPTEERKKEDVYDQDEDSPYGIFFVEGMFLSAASQKTINFGSGEDLTTERLVNAIDPESGYTALTATVAILKDLDKTTPAIEHKETYTRLTVYFFESLIKTEADPTIVDGHGNTVFTVLDTLPRKPQEDIRKILIDNAEKYPQADVFIQKVMQEQERRKKIYNGYHYAISIGFGLFGAAVVHFSDRFLKSVPETPRLKS